MANERETELILAPGSYAFVQDNTKGLVNVLVGPVKQSLSNTDQLVVFDSKSGRFTAAAMAQAVQTFVTAQKGYYIVLRNPHPKGVQPNPGTVNTLSTGEQLNVGQIENLAGPKWFPLWPGQTAAIVQGHQLRSNQYLLVRVYDDEGARNHWNDQIVRYTSDESSPNNTKHKLNIDPKTLYTGQLICIKGTEVSFYMPPTGIEVLIDEDVVDEDKNRDPYVRDAVTLENLEYCILVGENGQKRYAIGPDVVFPEPTEVFVVEEGKRKFRAIELTETSGIHVQVIMDYKEGDVEYTAGQELFLTGKDQIYYPRPAHAIIRYGAQQSVKHFAIAIPEGEGRYILNRLTGDIKLVKGPAMYLPDPRVEVATKRSLSDTECQLWYPGNAEALAWNRKIRPTIEGPEVDRGGGPSGAMLENYGGGAYENYLSASSAAFAAPAAAAAPAPDVLRKRAVYRRESASKGSAFGDVVNRGTTWTPPRTVTLYTKYEGAPRIEIWTGFAVQIVNRKGDRHTEVGPKTTLLGYDETMTLYTLSKGKPKTPDNTERTVYLKVNNNTVSDIISVKTRDLVPFTLAVKYLVRFEQADVDKWFDIDNYVQYMCDHLRSVVTNYARTVDSQTFYENAPNLLRDLVLGMKDETSGERKLCHFTENGMTVYDMEVGSPKCDDSTVANLLNESRQSVLRNTINLESEKRTAELTDQMEEYKRQTAAARQATKLSELDAAEELAARNRDAANLVIQHELNTAKTQSEIDAEELARTKAERDLNESYTSAEHQRRIAAGAAEAEAVEKKAKAIQPELVAALSALAAVGMTPMLEKMAPLAIVRDQAIGGVLDTLFEGTALQPALDNLKNVGKGRLINK